MTNSKMQDDFMKKEMIKNNVAFTQFVYSSIPEFPKSINRGDIFILADLYFGENNYYPHTVSDSLEKLKRDGVIFLPERGVYSRPTDVKQLAHSFRRRVRPLNKRKILFKEEVRIFKLRKELKKALRTQKEILGTADKPKKGRRPSPRHPENGVHPETPATPETEK